MKNKLDWRFYLVASIALFLSFKWKYAELDKEQSKKISWQLVAQFDTLKKRTDSAIVYGQRWKKKADSCMGK